MEVLMSGHEVLVQWVYSDHGRWKL
jgi:hypothetical protein